MLGITEFNDLYDKVFDETGAVKAVGRDCTKSLIEVCEQFSDNIDFGNKFTGFMNIENIQLLRNMLQKV